MGVSLGDLRRRHDRAMQEIDDLLRQDRRKRRGIERAERHLRELRQDRERAERSGDVEAARELDQQAKAVHAKIAARHDDRQAIHREITEAEKAAARAEAAIERKSRKRIDVIECFDGCAVPRGWKVILLDARENGWTGRLNSGDRTAKNVDHCGDKMSQPELWAAFQNGTGAPANPPASYCPSCGGTHEYVNDGTAYPNEPKGKRGPWWWLGIDAGNGDQLVDVLNRRGFNVRRPYMPREPWHLNLVGDPTPVIVRRELLLPNFAR